MTSKYILSLILRWICLLATLVMLQASASTTMAAPNTVYAVLFYSPSCSHCHQVMEEDLPPLMEKYGLSLNIIGIDVTEEIGQKVYRAAVERFNIPEERLGVPCLIIGETVLVGSREIPEQLPSLIEDGLAVGGVPLPDIPELDLVISDAQSIASSSESQDTAVNASGGTNRLSVMLGKFNQDKIGNTISVIVLVGMLISLISVSYQFQREGEVVKSTLPDWIIPLIAIAGAGVALYLSIIEITQSQAICGPVGDCNSVQQSPYARLFGILPIGVLGVIGYLAVLAVWLVKRFSSGSIKKYAELAIWLMALAGVVFSIYLTFLEPFVIGATCMWCITSAILMTILLWVSANPAKSIWNDYEQAS